MRILVSGASGFVGGAVVKAAAARGTQVRALGRGDDGRYRPQGTESVSTSVIETTDGLGWRGVDCVVHCAGRAHVMHDVADDPQSLFRASNVEGSLALARDAFAAGVRRFVFISSIKVNGERTERGAPFLAGDVPRPIDPYGVSKYEAEKGLLKLSAETGVEVVIIRPVLVYGPGVKANFLGMMRWLNRRIPLPFGLIDNRRSLVGLDNLVDLILTAAAHPKAAGETFLVSDGEDLSTPELLNRTASALGTTPRLFPVPPTLLTGMARLAGQQAAIARLCGSLQIDLGHTRETLGWAPPSTVDDELARTARHFLATQ